MPDVAQRGVISLEPGLAFTPSLNAGMDWILTAAQLGLNSSAVCLSLSLSDDCPSVVLSQFCKSALSQSMTDSTK